MGLLRQCSINWTSSTGWVQILYAWTSPIPITKTLTIFSVAGMFLQVKPSLKIVCCDIIPCPAIYLHTLSTLTQPTHTARLCVFAVLNGGCMFHICSSLIKYVRNAISYLKQVRILLSVYMWLYYKYMYIHAYAIQKQCYLGGLHCSISSEWLQCLRHLTLQWRSQRTTC